MEVSDWISIASLIISVVFGLRTIYIEWIQRKQKKRLDNQEEQINAITLKRFNEENEAKKKAEIHCSILPTGQTYKLIISNKGKCAARNIRMYLPDISQDDAGIKILVQQDCYPELDSGEHYSVGMSLFIGHVPSVKIKFTWDDDFGNSREREQILSLTS